MMLYPGSDHRPRTGTPAPAADERRAFSRRIDCDDTGRVRPPVNPSPSGRATREAQPARAGRRIDID